MRKQENKLNFMVFYVLTVAVISMKKKRKKKNLNSEKKTFYLSEIKAVRAKTIEKS